MKHGIYRITSFRIVAPYTLGLEFDDGVSRIVDFEPVLCGEMYGPLRDPALFEQVRLDPEAHTLVWPNGADFDPATLHDWPMVREALVAMALRWTETTTGEPQDSGEES
jgi:hypothetical protein